MVLAEIDTRKTLADLEKAGFNVKQAKCHHGYCFSC